MIFAARRATIVLPGLLSSYEGIPLCCVHLVPYINPVVVSWIGLVHNFKKWETFGIILPCFRPFVFVFSPPI